MGGLQKEFFQLIAESVFDPAYGMFTYSEESRNLWINGMYHNLLLLSKGQIKGPVILAFAAHRYSDSDSFA